MAQQTINIGASPNDGTGTPLRTAFQYTNSNFSELYTAVGPSGNNIVVPGSATITGDLTAARLIVTGGTIPTNGLWLPTTNTLEFAANSLAQYRIAPLGVFSWYDGAGGTRMTLNATGLGIGASPTNKLTIGTGSYAAGTLSGTSSLYSTVAQGLVVLADGFNISTRIGGDRFTLDTSGNVGIGVTPSAWASSGGPTLQLGGANGAIAANAQYLNITSNAYYSSGYKYIGTGNAASYAHEAGKHVWYTAPSGTAGNAITFTQAMTLDASGNLLVGTTVISPSINGAGAITAKGVAGITVQTVSALATDYTLPIGAFAGILTIRSNGSGGSAVWMLDPNAGAVQISNNIVGRTITFAFSGGSWKMQQTVGTVPSTYNYLVLATQ